MTESRDARTQPSPVGFMLREWRTLRGHSQLSLSLDTGISTRHLSYVETGRAEPSRELLLRLSTALGMSPRDRNALLQAAGYQPIHRETPWESPENAELCQAVRLILRQNEPFGAVALDRDYHIVMCNRGFSQFFALVAGRTPLVPYVVLPKPRVDLLALTFDPEAGVRPHIVNWEQVACSILWLARAELAARRDRRASDRFAELLRFPGVEALLASPERATSGVLLPVEIAVGEVSVRLFTTITTLGTPSDVTASELRIECYHPADAATEALVRALGA